MHLLLTNDDGIDAIGIKHLHQALEGYDLSVVAPKSEMSGCGMSISVRHDIAVTPSDNFSNAFAVSGTPADCMKLALSEHFVKKPDWILSGINCGSNAGRNTFYSGTVAAVIEGALHGIPGIAFSCVGNEEHGFDIRDDAYEIAEKFIPSIFNFFKDKKIPQGSFINVNFPFCSYDDIKGIKLTPQSMDFWSDAPFQSKEGDNPQYYQIGSELRKYPEQIHSDAYLLREGFITCTPVQARDMTDLNLLQGLESEFKHSFPLLREKVKS